MIEKRNWRPRLESRDPQLWYNLSAVLMCHRIIWSAGVLAAMGNITYPSISSFVSAHASDDQQGYCSTICYLSQCLHVPDSWQCV